MHTDFVIDVIKKKFSGIGPTVTIPNLKNDTFQAELCAKGIKVDNLGNEPLLVWDVFIETFQFLLIHNGWVLKGSVIGPNFDYIDPHSDSLEWRIATVVYKKKKGDRILPRVESIASILIWAGICEDFNDDSFKLTNELISRDDDNFSVHWNYYISLEKDVEQLSRYIEFSEENFNTYSIQLAHLLLAISSEVDVVAKAVCKEIEYESTAENIRQYRLCIKEKYTSICKESVQITRHKLSFTPWKAWSKNESPTWWKEYNGVKHNRRENFKDANLGNVLDALAGLLVMILYLRKAQNYNSKNIFSNVVYSAFNPRPQFFRFSDPYYDFFENNK